MINNVYDLFPCFKIENEYYDFEKTFQKYGLTIDDFNKSGELWLPDGVQFFIDDVCICHLTYDEIITFKKVENFIPIKFVNSIRIPYDVNIKRKGEIVLHTNKLSDLLEQYFNSANYYDISIELFKNCIIPFFEQCGYYDIIISIDEIFKKYKNDINFAYISF